MNFDEHLDREIDKHNQENEDAEEVSNCCGVYVLGDSDICSDCKEHCVVITLGEFSTNGYENAMEDNADMQRDLRRDDV